MDKQAFIAEVFQEYKKLLQEFIKFKSVSTNQEYQNEINSTADWLNQLFISNNFKSKLITGYDNPLVLVEFYQNENFPTVLIYGHYDVQPADINDGWSSDPFSLTETNNRIIARGAVDNKGQVLIHIATIFKLIQKNQLKYNVKFLIEGNEESGSPNIERFIEENKEILSCDFVLISDGEISAKRPNIEVGFRGTFNATLEIKVGSQDLHSGIYGSTAPNAIHVLANLLSKIHDEYNKILIPNYYENIDPITDEVRKNNTSIPFDLDEYKRITTRKDIILFDNNDFYTQTGLYPCIEVTGIIGGYTGEGYKNAIPHKATAKINFRLVSHQTTQELFDKFKNFISENIPKYADFSFEMDSSNEALKIDINNKYVDHARSVLEEVWGEKVIYKYVGGSLPITNYFYNSLNVPLVMIPLANEDCNMHGVDENFDKDYLMKGINFSLHFFSTDI